jgi:ABC-2 type transport system ATP-binding protein
MSGLIEVHELRRDYGALEALKGVSFSVHAGEIVGLLGPNGAGKSTTMKVLTGWLAPTAGTARVAGHDVLTDPMGVRRSIGYLPENAPAYVEMRVRDWLGFAGEVRGLGAAEQARAIERVTADCGLDGRLDQRIGTLSRGYRQRVGLAQALLHQPAVLILDEPTTGLDPNQVVEMRALIRRVGATRTVVLSTHVLPEVVATCDRVLILHEGRLVADDGVDSLSRSAAGQTISVSIASGKVQADAQQLEDELGALDGVEAVHRVTPVDSAHRFLVHTRADGRETVYRWAVARGHVLVELSTERRSLEEVFRSLTVGAP